MDTDSTGFHGFLSVSIRQNPCSSVGYWNGTRMDTASSYGEIGNHRDGSGVWKAWGRLCLPRLCPQPVPEVER